MAVTEVGYQKAGNNSLGEAGMWFGGAETDGSAGPEGQEPAGQHADLGQTAVGAPNVQPDAADLAAEYPLTAERRQAIIRYLKSDLGENDEIELAKHFSLEAVRDNDDLKDLIAGYIDQVEGEEERAKGQSSSDRQKSLPAEYKQTIREAGLAIKKALEVPIAHDNLWKVNELISQALTMIEETRSVANAVAEDYSHDSQKKADVLNQINTELNNKSKMLHGRLDQINQLVDVDSEVIDLGDIVDMGNHERARYRALAEAPFLVAEGSGGPTKFVFESQDIAGPELEYSAAVAGADMAIKAYSQDARTLMLVCDSLSGAFSGDSRDAQQASLVAINVFNAGGGAREIQFALEKIWPDINMAGLSALIIDNDYNYQSLRFGNAELAFGHSETSVPTVESSKLPDVALDRLRELHENDKSKLFGTHEDFEAPALLSFSDALNQVLERLAGNHPPQAPPDPEFRGFEGAMQLAWDAYRNADSRQDFAQIMFNRGILDEAEITNDFNKDTYLGQLESAFDRISDSLSKSEYRYHSEVGSGYLRPGNRIALANTALARSRGIRGLLGGKPGKKERREYQDDFREVDNQNQLGISYVVPEVQADQYPIEDDPASTDDEQEAEVDEVKHGRDWSKTLKKLGIPVIRRELAVTAATTVSAILAAAAFSLTGLYGGAPDQGPPTVQPAKINTIDGAELALGVEQATSTPKLDSGQNDQQPAQLMPGPEINIEPGSGMIREFIQLGAQNPEDAYRYAMANKREAMQKIIDGGIAYGDLESGRIGFNEVTTDGDKIFANGVEIDTETALAYIQLMNDSARATNDLPSSVVV